MTHSLTPDQLDDIIYDRAMSSSYCSGTALYSTVVCLLQQYGTKHAAAYMQKAGASLQCALIWICGQNLPADDFLDWHTSCMDRDQ